MKTPAPSSKLAYTQDDAAKLLSVGLNTFKTHVSPYIKVVWIGNSARYTHAELQKWLDQNAQTP